MGILTSCIIGVILIAIGLVSRLYPPQHINNSLGYRTPFAMKNKDTWYEGNRFCGTMFLISGIIFIPFSMLMTHLYSNNLNFSARISGVGLFILLISSVIFTEVHLRKLFDKSGIRK